jgi:hypothetical protein
MKTDKENHSQGDHANPLAAFLIAGSIFLERFIYYAGRSMLLLFVVQELGMDEFRNSFRNSMVLIMILAGITGIMLDFMVRERTMIILGALMNTIGLAAIATGFDVAVVAGFGLVLVGSSATRISSFAYFGWMLGERSDKLDGGFSLMWVILNTSALLGSLVMGLLVLEGGITYQTGFYVLASLALLNVVLVAVFSGLGFLPAATTTSVRSRPKIFLQFLGGVVLLLLAASLFVYHFWMLQSSFLLMSETLLFSVLVAVIVLGFILYSTSPGGNAIRRNGIMLLLMLLCAFTWALVQLSSGVAIKQIGAEQNAWRVSLQAILAIVLSLGVGIFFLFRKSRDLKGFTSAGLRILICAIFVAIGAGSILLYPYIGLYSVAGSMLFMTVSEVVFGFAINATVWRITSVNRRGTALGLMMSSAGLGMVFANWFSSGGMDIGGKPDFTVPTLGLCIIALVTVFAGLAAWTLVRNHQTEGSNPQSSPFE